MSASLTKKHSQPSKKHADFSVIANQGLYAIVTQCNINTLIKSLADPSWCLVNTWRVTLGFVATEKPTIASHRLLYKLWLRRLRLLDRGDVERVHDFLYVGTFLGKLIDLRVGLDP